MQFFLMDMCLINQQKILRKKNRTQIYITYCEPKFKNTRKKYFLEKFKNCPPNLSNKKNKFVFKN